MIGIDLEKAPNRVLRHGAPIGILEHLLPEPEVGLGIRLHIGGHPSLKLAYRVAHGSAHEIRARLIGASPARPAPPSAQTTGTPSRLCVSDAGVPNAPANTAALRGA